LAWITGWVGVVRQKGLQFFLAEAATLHEAEIIEKHTFFIHRRGKRGHRTGRGAANVGMVPSRGGPEQDFSAGIVKYRRHHRDVRQMSAAIIGSIERKHVTRTNVTLVEPDDGLHRTVHRAEVYRHMR